MVNRLKRAIQAEYLAEAGLAHTLGILQADFSGKNNPLNFPLTTLGPGTYDAAITETNGRVMISSTGAVQGVQRTVKAEVKGPTESALSYILSGGGKIELKLSAYATAAIVGNVYANDEIELKAKAAGSSIVLQNLGNAYAGDDIEVDGNITMGSVNPNWSVIGFPVFDYGFYQSVATANGYTYNGDQTFTSANPIPFAPTGGVIFVNGSMTITASQATTACLIATGNIDITQGTVTISQYNDYPALMSQNGNITIRSVGAVNQGKLAATGLIYAGGNFSMSGNHDWVEITGAIVARGKLEESGTHDTLILNYQAPNPPGLLSSGATPMTILSYNT
ncbi:MAG: hypothetical protein HY593_00395 [Candidatus Omnitrophica bacterium]|nr:hypothetical protein [Candidatus Omnitrophota bacterium]